MVNDPLKNDPGFYKTVESWYDEMVRRHNAQNPDNPMSMTFDEYWNSQTDDVKEQMYKQAKTGYENWWDKTKADQETRANYDKDYDDAVREAVAAGVQVDPNGEMFYYRERYDKQKKKVVFDQVPMGKPSALQLRIMITQMKADKQKAESRLKDLEFGESLRPQAEEIYKRKAEEDISKLKQASTARKISTFNKLITEPVAEIVSGGMRAVAGDRMSATKYGKGAMKVAQQSFVPSAGTGTYRESPLRPAPRGRFTTPMVTRVPERMPITTSRSGKKIPAGEAVIAPAKAVKEAVIKPTEAGSLLQTSVGKMPAAQLMVAPRPTRIGLSNLRVGVDTSGIRKGGALPKLKLKRNLYNEQLRRIRGMLK